MADSWNPDIYLRYEQYRARPAHDLIAQIDLNGAGDIVDLGCGPGNVTKLLKDKWPDRQVTGVDKSEAMLAKARAACTEISWKLGDIATWSGDDKKALVFSNAALHWVSDHAQVLPRLIDAVVSGGVLAFQIPVTEDSAYQICIRATVQSERWRDKLAGVWMYKNPMEPAALYDVLSPSCAVVDIWETDYHHVLEGDNPVVDWIQGTGLTPYLAVLDDGEKPQFLADYSARVKEVYPPQADGKTLFVMKRIFTLARKA